MTNEILIIYDSPENKNMCLSVESIRQMEGEVEKLQKEGFSNIAVEYDDILYTLATQSVSEISKYIMAQEEARQEVLEVEGAEFELFSMEQRKLLEKNPNQHFDLLTMAALANKSEQEFYKMVQQEEEEYLKSLEEETELE